MVRDLRNDYNTLTVYSTGYGLQHNAGLLTELATEGNGSYTIVHNQEHVAAVFGDILGGLLSCVAQNVEIIMPKEIRPTTRFRIIEAGDLKKVQLGDIYADTEQMLVIEGSGPITISYLTPSGEIKSLVPVVEEATDSISQEFVATTLRLRAADILASGRAAGTSTINGLIEEIEALAVQPAWAAIVLPELESLSVPAAFIRGPTVSGMQQAAVLRMGRGLISQTVSATEDDPLNTAFIVTDPDIMPSGPPGLSQCFSSPTQRQVTGRLRQISSGIPSST
jgi:hypothetical protein